MTESENVLVQNRGFFRRMRNFYYEKAWNMFQKLGENISSGLDVSHESIVGLLYEYIEVMELTTEYAHNAVRGYKRKKIKMFRHDNEKGVMEEELVFVSFLEELLSSSIYLRNRFETNEYIRNYIEGINNRVDYEGGKKGFLSNILANMKADEDTDNEEIIQIARLLGKRFRIANNIFSVMQKRKNFFLVK